MVVSVGGFRKHTLDSSATGLWGGSVRLELYEIFIIGTVCISIIIILLMFLPGVFRESGGARCAHNMVPYPICRQAALGIVQQLVLSNSGDDDMGTLLGLMHTAPVLALDLKTHILKVCNQI